MKNEDREYYFIYRRHSRLCRHKTTFFGRIARVCVCRCMAGLDLYLLRRAF